WPCAHHAAMRARWWPNAPPIIIRECLQPRIFVIVSSSARVRAGASNGAQARRLADRGARDIVRLLGPRRRRHRHAARTVFQPPPALCAQDPRAPCRAHSAGTAAASGRGKAAAQLAREAARMNVNDIIVQVTVAVMVLGIVAAAGVAIYRR